MKSISGRRKSAKEKASYLSTKIYKMNSSTMNPKSIISKLKTKESTAFSNPD